ncbi:MULTISPECIES: protein YpfM [Citrobacter freundii complex]|nr:protein YpfM [Citrobacter freundii]MCY3450817.1 protein YpfM [Citrobacter freundii]
MIERELGNWKDFIEVMLGDAANLLI